MNCICVRMARAKCTDPRIDTETGEQSCGVTEALSNAAHSGAIQLIEDNPDGPEVTFDPHAFLAALPAHLTLRLGARKRNGE